MDLNLKMKIYRVEVYLRGVWRTLYVKAFGPIDARVQIQDQVNPLKGVVYAGRVWQTEAKPGKLVW